MLLSAAFSSEYSRYALPTSPQMVTEGVGYAYLPVVGRPADDGFA